MKIKTLFYFSIIFLSVFSVNAQKNNQIRTYFGFVDNDLIYFEQLDGSEYHETSKSLEFGIKYLRKITNKLSLETGLNYEQADVKFYKSIPCGTNNHKIEKFKSFSIPLYINFNFGRFFFLNGGPILDFQTVKRTFDSQSGIGASLGLGFKYDFDRYTIFANPNIKVHALLPFKSERHQQHLIEQGIQIGLGYSF